MDEKVRCSWAGDDPLYIRYHDEEWGRPLHDDRALFELLILEGMQAGLSWICILRKREAFREAFEGFDPEKVAAFDDQKIEALMQNPAIVRNRRKLTAAVDNARAFLALQREYGSFDRWIWSFVGGEPVLNYWESLSEMPCKGPLSQKISSELVKRGFRFVGPTIIYSFLQAAGLVNNHVHGCFLFPGAAAER
ncbi:MAG: DNA-3-methyladenine glycosylase I [Clostridiaceae bacterium]|nr:DNA-3-methyladenine glycosylase I [Clostridiaceae bacterium]